VAVGETAKLKFERLWETLEQLCVQTDAAKKTLDDLQETLVHLRSTIAVDGLEPPEDLDEWYVSSNWPPQNE
jgi:hypothetical protein